MGFLATTAKDLRADSGPWEINGGLWRTDSGFTSTVQLKNRLATGPIAVVPVLFMADGTEYDLPVVNVPASGVATVNVNRALESAPSAIADHVSGFGSATLRFDGSRTALIAQTGLGSPTLSLSYSAPFTPVASGTPAQRTLEGLWWARDAGIGGFVSLSNATSAVRNVTVQFVAADGEAQPSQSFSLGPHNNRMLDLLSLAGRKLAAGEAGGLRIQYSGLAGEVNVVGGLENREEGYSAAMPFWIQSSAANASADGASVTLGHAGILVGAPDGAMGFPVGTRFAPYLALRNLTGQVVRTTLTLYTEQGKALQGPDQSLQPNESRQVDMAKVLQGLGLKDLNGAFTLAVGHPGKATDVMVSAGSVDAKGTYVFEAAGRVAEKTLSKQTPYWTVKNGSDTMVAVWNPSSAPEDMIVTLNFAGASGHYRFPVHLAPYATANLDLKDLIADRSQDDEGNLIPSEAQEGSIAIQNAGERHKEIEAIVNVGIYNVAKGTCYYGYVQCDGYTAVNIVPSSVSLAAGTSQNVNSYGLYYDGSEVPVSANWGCSDTSVVTLSNYGGTAGLYGNKAGSVSVSASANLIENGDFYGYDPTCGNLQPTVTFTGHANVVAYDATPTISSVSPTSYIVGQTSTVTISGSGFGTNQPQITLSLPATVQYIASNSTTIYLYVTPTSAGTGTFTVTSEGYAGQSFQDPAGSPQESPKSKTSGPVTASLPTVQVAPGPLTIMAYQSGPDPRSPIANCVNITAGGQPSGGSFEWSTFSPRITLQNYSTPTVTACSTSGAFSAAIGDVTIDVVYKVGSSSSNIATTTLTVSKPQTLIVQTDTTNATGHACIQGSGIPTENQSYYADTLIGAHYTSYVRLRTYSLQDSLKEPVTLSTNMFEAYSPSEAQISVGTGTSPYPSDYFIHCSQTCRTGGNDSIESTQSIYANNFLIAAKAVGWTCSGATIIP